LSGPFHKLLKDFRLNEWFEAADGCEACGAKYKIRVLDVDKDGVCGTVEWAITHSAECPERFDDDLEEEPAVTESDMDVAGWEFMPNTFTFRGKQYYPLKSRANIGPCLSCGKLVIGVPLILFIDKGRKGELDFCWNCVKRLGIMEIIKK